MLRMSLDCGHSCLVPIFRAVHGPSSGTNSAKLNKVAGCYYTQSAPIATAGWWHARHDSNQDCDSVPCFWSLSCQHLTNVRPRCVLIDLSQEGSQQCCSTSHTLPFIVWPTAGSRGRCLGRATDGDHINVSYRALRSGLRLILPSKFRSRRLYGPEVPISDRCVGYEECDALDDEGSRQIENAQNYDDVYHAATTTL